MFDGFRSIPCLNSRQPSVVASVQANCVQFHPLDTSHLYIGADTVSTPPPLPLLPLPPSSCPSPSPPASFLSYIIINCRVGVVSMYLLISGFHIESSEDHVCHQDSCHVQAFLHSTPSSRAKFSISRGTDGGPSHVTTCPHNQRGHVPVMSLPSASRHGNPITFLLAAPMAASDSTTPGEVSGG